MMRIGLMGVLCALAGCPSGDDSTDDYPIAPGGGTNVSGGEGDGTDVVPVDADGIDASSTLNGRVCVTAPLSSVFADNVCATEGVVDVTVELDGQTATTNGAGNFTIMAGDPLAPWHVTADTLMPTVMRQSASNILHAVSPLHYEDALEASGAPPAETGQGGIFVRIVRDDGTGRLVPEMGATMTSDRQTTQVTLYDDGTMFGPGGTGTRGLAWVTAANVGTSVLTIEASNGDPYSYDVPVENGAVTFQQIVLPAR